MEAGKVCKRYWEGVEGVLSCGHKVGVTKKNLVPSERNCGNRGREYAEI